MPQERLLPGHHAESLSAAQLAPSGSASADGGSEPESSVDNGEGRSDADDLAAEQHQRTGRKRGRREAEEGLRPESSPGRDTDGAG